MIIERKRKELDPMLRQIERLRDIEDNNANAEELQAFNATLKSIYEMGKTTDNLLSAIHRKKKTKIIKWINKLKR